MKTKLALTQATTDDLKKAIEEGKKALESLQKNANKKSMHSKWNKAKQNAQNQLIEAKNFASDKTQAFYQDTKKMVTQGYRYAIDNPVKTIGIASVAGLAIGLFFKMRAEK